MIDADLMYHTDQTHHTHRIHDTVHGSLVLVHRDHHRTHSPRFLQILQTMLQTHLVPTYLHVLHDDVCIAAHVQLVDTVLVLVHELVDNIVRMPVHDDIVLVHRLVGIARMLALVDTDPVH